MTHNSETVQSAEDTSDVPAAVEAGEDNECVLRLIGDLPSNQQKVIRLRFHAGLAYREISESTGLSVSNVGYLLHTALGKLREQMQSQDA